MDLGIVKSVDENTQTTSTALGTPKYMPPEMLSEAEIDGRADQYSLAVIAYQALVGDPPFVGPTPMAILYKQAHEAPEPLRKRAPDVPRNLAAAVEKALAKDPDDRFRDINAFAAGVRADAATVSSGTSRGTIAAVAAIILAALGWWMTRPDPTAVAADAAQIDVVDAARPDRAAVDVAEVDAAAPKVIDAAAPTATDAGVPEVVDAAPKPKTRYVTVKVSSDPAGAVVYERGRALGRTPLALRRPMSGRALNLTLKRAGYSPVKLRASVRKDGKVRAKLEPIFELVP